jgi:fatty-acid desaturase
MGINLTPDEIRRLSTALFMAAFHIAAAAILIFYLSWWGLLTAVIVWFFGACFGVGVGFHRLLTHGGFQTPKIVEYTLTLFGCLALQGSPMHWVAVHRKHHRYTDVPGRDPHSPSEGFWWAHIGWMLLENPAIDANIIPDYVRTMTRDRFHRWAHKYWWGPAIVVGAFLLILGWCLGGNSFALELFLWGSIVHIPFGWHISWSVNSFGHRLGSRTYDDLADDSTNNWVVNLLTFGEGWHNNHHAFPYSARHGLKRWQIDINYGVILLLQYFKLARNLKLAKMRR